MGYMGPRVPQSSASPYDMNFGYRMDCGNAQKVYPRLKAQIDKQARGNA